MKIHDRGTDKESVQYRVRIEGTLNGKPWVYEDPEKSDGSQFLWVKENDPSTFWWSEGNMCCDCNRAKFVPIELRANLPLDTDDGYECGNNIFIDRIIPLEGDSLPTLELNETIKGKS